MFTALLRLSHMTPDVMFTLIYTGSTSSSRSLLGLDNLGLHSLGRGATNKREIISCQVNGVGSTGAFIINILKTVVLSVYNCSTRLIDGFVFVLGPVVSATKT